MVRILMNNLPYGSQSLLVELNSIIYPLAELNSKNTYV